MRQQKLKIQDLEKVNKDMMKVMHTVFPRSSDPFYIVKLIYKKGTSWTDSIFIKEVLFCDCLRNTSR